MDIVQQKKGMFSGRKTLLILLFGLLLIALGLVPILNQLKIIIWQLPVIPKTILDGLLVLAGLYLIFSGLFGPSQHKERAQKLPQKSTPPQHPKK